MKNVSDVLTVSFDRELKDESALCVTRKCGETIIMLKMELGEQADILYHLLTEQMTKAEIKPQESEGQGMTTYELYFDQDLKRDDFLEAESEEVCCIS